MVTFNDLVYRQKASKMIHESRECLRKWPGSLIDHLLMGLWRCRPGSRGLSKSDP